MRRLSLSSNEWVNFAIMSSSLIGLTRTIATITIDGLEQKLPRTKGAEDQSFFFGQFTLFFFIDFSLKAKLPSSFFLIN